MWVVWGLVVGIAVAVAAVAVLAMRTACPFIIISGQGRRRGGMEGEGRGWRGVREVKEQGLVWGEEERAVV